MLHELPIELLGMVFGFMEVKELYPSCFLISKQCLCAVSDDEIWKARCGREFGVSTKSDEAKTWMQTYKGKTLNPIIFSFVFFLCFGRVEEKDMQWDSQMCTLPPAERQLLTTQLGVSEGDYLARDIVLGTSMKDKDRAPTLLPLSLASEKLPGLAGTYTFDVLCCVASYCYCYGSWRFVTICYCYIAFLLRLVVLCF